MEYKRSLIFMQTNLVRRNHRTGPAFLVFMRAALAKTLEVGNLFIHPLYGLCAFPAYRDILQAFM